MLALATRLRITPGGLTRIIDRLVDRGWIQRDRPADNRREVYATLPPAGAAAPRTAPSALRPLHPGALPPPPRRARPHHPGPHRPQAARSARVGTALLEPAI